MVSGCAVAAIALAALSGCGDRPGMDVVSGELHAANSVIMIELSEHGWTTYTDRNTALACAVLRSSTTGQLRDHDLAGIVYSQAMVGRDAGVQSAARALYEAAGTHRPDTAKLVSGMRTACYVYELRSTSVAGSVNHSYEGW